MLLEVLLALGLLVFGLGVVGMRVSTSMQTAQKDQLWTTGILLTETVMSKVQGGDITFQQGEDELKGHFKIYYPGFSWRIKIRPCEIDDLFLLTLEIGFNAEDRESQIQSPEREIDFENDGTKTIRTAYRLVSKPADLNLTRDMGIDAEALQLDQLEEATGQGEGGGGGEGGSAPDPMSALLGMVREFLTKNPQIINAGGGIDFGEIMKLPPDSFKEAMALLQLLGGGGGDSEGEIKKLLETQLETQPPE